MKTKLFSMCAMVALSTVVTASATELGNTKNSPVDNIIIVWAGDDGQKTAQASDMFNADNKNENPENEFIFLEDDQQIASLSSELGVWIERK